MKIELWTKDCYGCDRHGKYTAIRQYIIDNHIPLKNFEVKRIQLDPRWTKEAIAFDVELPLLRFDDEKGNITMINYDEWLRREKKNSVKVIETVKKARKKRVKKTASIKQEEVITKGED